MSPKASRREPRAIIIGCGFGGIGLAVNLKRKLDYHNFIIYEREDDIGGTWYLNTYPGVGCDVDTHVYSFSFNPNPNWSRRFADQPEILQYLRDTADKYDVRSHVQLRTEVVSAKWVEKSGAEKDGFWRVTLRHVATGEVFERSAEILVSCVGAISVPADCNIPGKEKYNGTVFHSARWNHDFDITGKKIAVVGNGCSAAQIIPTIAPEVDKVVQFQRSPQWITDRPNGAFSEFSKAAFRWVPGLLQAYRFMLWKQTDALHHLYLTNSTKSAIDRDAATQDALAYMKKTAPEEYHDILIPKFPFGCKRRVFDPGYLESLHRENVELTTERIVEFTETGLRTEQRDIEFDAVVLATGYKIQEFLTPIEVVGRDGISLNQHWKDTDGAQAYRATFVTGFPNFGIVFGPNAFPAHNSVIFTVETQGEFILKTVFAPIIRGDFSVIDVKEAAEMRDANYVQQQLKHMVWEGGCNNWNRNEQGRNTTNYHDFTWKFWYKLFWPQWEDFNIDGDRGTRPLHPVARLCTGSAAIVFALGSLGWLQKHNVQVREALVRAIGSRA